MCLFQLGSCKKSQETGDLLDTLLTDGDDYKLVFLSSDSSSKEDIDDNDSSSTTSSFLLDDCDWDYFEPGASNRPILNWNSPFGSPRVCRRAPAESPLGSPLVFRRTRESDTGTDDDISRLDSGSPASSDSLNVVKNRDVNEDLSVEKGMDDAHYKCLHKIDTPDSSQTVKPLCYNCGAAPTQYIPVPVPVPIPVPIPAIWSSQDSLMLHNPELLEQIIRSRLRTISRTTWPFFNHAAFIWPLINNAAGDNVLNTPLSALRIDEAEVSERSNTDGSVSVSADRNDGSVARELTNRTTNNKATSTRDDSVERNPVNEQIQKKNAMIIKGDSELLGHLNSENKLMSSSETSEDSTDSDVNDEEVQNRTPRVRRMYVVSAVNPRESDDALPSSDMSDREEEINNELLRSENEGNSEDFISEKSQSTREDITSSGSSDTDTDTDDTGTVADRKPKRFSRVFVLNQRNTSSTSSIDTSDNDTDVDFDCGVVFKAMKYLHDEEECPEAVILLKHNICDNESDLRLTNDTTNANNRCQNSFIKPDDTVSAFKEKDYFSPSPGLSEVSAESINSSDVELNKITSNSEDNLSENDLKTVEGNNLINKQKEHKHVFITVKEKCSAVSENFKCENTIVETDENEHNDSNIKVPIDLEINECHKVNNKKASDAKSFTETESLSSRLKFENSQEGSFNTKFKNVRRNETANGSHDLQQFLHSNISKGKSSAGVDFLCETITTKPLLEEGRTSRSSERLREVTESGIRSTDGIVPVVGDQKVDGHTECAGETVISESDGNSRHAVTKYTSLVMITQENAHQAAYPQVSVVTSDTTTLVPRNDVVVRHTNLLEKDKEGNVTGDNVNDKSLANYFTLTLENCPSPTPRKPKLNKTPYNLKEDENKEVTVVASSDHSALPKENQNNEGVTVVTGANTLSAVVCLEEGLADDDSWVENISHDEDEFDPTSPEDSSGEEVTLTCSAAIDHEDELRGYHRAAIDFTLHTIVEESCEESEVEQTQVKKKQRPTSATDLEKYFFFGLGDGNIPSINSNRDDALSETSSIYSEGMDSLGGPDEQQQVEEIDPAELASSRLEKYFLSGFMGFSMERRDSDGSVGSDSEGRPSPEQRRKRLVRARGSGRSHSSSLDNLLLNPDLNTADQSENQISSQDSSSSDSDTYEEGSNTFEKSDGQFDTVKRKKCKKQKGLQNGSNSSAEETKTLESTQENDERYCSEEERKTPQPDITNVDLSKTHQCRDSGFVGSQDDLIKDHKETHLQEINIIKDNIEGKKLEEKLNFSTPPATSLTRKDSFNNWSSDEETNLMMCKMRQFFKTMVAATNSPNSKPSTPVSDIKENSPKPIPSPRMKNRSKPPQLVYFENELTRLMKTVPGIKDEQVREIVEYLSSEDTWSDSYDSSDYTSSDLECTGKSELQQQISDSCQKIINNFDSNKTESNAESPNLNKETAFVYQKLVASFEKMAIGDEGKNIAAHSSPPLIAKVMHHIGSRLVALMHEVSSGESHASNSPRVRHYHRRLQQKLSNASTTTTEDDDSTSDSNIQEKLVSLNDIGSCNLLPRSRSHDLLVGETKNHHQSSSGVSDINEERETSDCERFSWRGSFESALLATDSRTKLTLLSSDSSGSASTLAAKRRSAGDLLFSLKSLSREQLDRVRSCGSIGGANSEDKLWVSSSSKPSRRRSSVPDASCGSGGSADGEDDDEDELENRSTLPRSLQSNTASTNSLPRLPMNTPPVSMHKSHSMYHFLQQNVKSARYRPPGFNRLITTTPKRAVSAPGLQPSHQRRGRRSQQLIVPSGKFFISIKLFKIYLSIKYFFIIFCVIFFIFILFIIFLDKKTCFYEKKQRVLVFTIVLLSSTALHSKLKQSFDYAKHYNNAGGNYRTVVEVIVACNYLTVFYYYELQLIIFIDKILE